MRNYASSVEKGNNNTLQLHIYPGENGNFNWWKMMAAATAISKMNMR